MRKGGGRLLALLTTGVQTGIQLTYFDGPAYLLLFQRQQASLESHSKCPHIYLEMKHAQCIEDFCCVSYSSVGGAKSHSTYRFKYSVEITVKPVNHLR